MKPINSRSGFSLIELLTVVLIIGILAAIAIPSYTKYIKRSKLSEAISNLTAIDTYEETYFSEEDQYVCTPANPAAMPGADKHLFDSDLIDATYGSWPALGTVIADNTPVQFQYQVWAGRVNAAATAIDNTIAGLKCMGTALNQYYRPGLGCNPELRRLTGASNIPMTANSSFFIVTAVGDQNGDGVCSLLIKTVDRPDIFKQDELE